MHDKDLLEIRRTFEAQRGLLVIQLNEQMFEELLEFAEKAKQYEWLMDEKTVDAIKTVLTQHKAQQEMLGKVEAALKTDLEKSKRWTDRWTKGG